MTNLFQVYPFLRTRNPYYDYDPEKCAYLPGQPCQTCSKPIVYHQSISVCKCHRFCHSKCIIDFLEQSNTSHTFIIYQCSKCNEKLQISYAVSIQFKLHFNLQNLMNFIITAILLAITFFGSIQLKLDLSRLNVQTIVFSIVLGLLFAGFFACLINIFVVKEFRPVGVRPTNMGLVVSAFVELEDEQSQTEILRDIMHMNSKR